MPSPSPTSCLGQTGTSICVTPTHRGGSLLPSHVHGADPVTYVDAYLCCHPHSSAHNQMHTCVYMQAITHCHTPPRSVSSLCTPSRGHRLPCALLQVHLLRRHVESPRSPPQPPPQMAPGTQEPLLLASPGTSLPLTRSLGGWASTAKVDRRWHWQRVWAACVSSVWQLSVSQSPELASLGSRERGNEPQPGSAVPPPVPAAAQEEVRPRARPHPRGRQPEPRGLPLIP